MLLDSFEPPFLFEPLDFMIPGSTPAALLLHGYLGSPAEMRPLGEALNGCGWTVRGLTLPGFGADAAALPHRKAENWMQSARTALQELAVDHHPVILVGHSMGAAVSINIAERAPVDGLVVLAPFWRIASPAWSMLPLVRRMNPSVRLFRWLRLLYQDSAARLTMQKFMPWIDPEDPASRGEMHRFKLHLGMFDELRRLGLAAYQAVSRIEIPVLAIQGRQDVLARKSLTRTLMRRYAGPVRYTELNASHELLDYRQPAWRRVRSLVLAFAHRMEMASAAIRPGDQ